MILDTDSPAPAPIVVADKKLTSGSAALRRLVSAALVTHANNSNAAREAVMDMLRGDPVLREMVLEQSVQRIVDDILHETRTKQRYVLLGKRGDETSHEQLEASRPREDLLNGYEALAADNLLNWPMRGGLRLGDAKRPTIEAESSWAFKNARSYLTTAKWFKAIAALLPDDATTVQRILTHGQLQTLRAQAEGKKAEVTA